MRSNKWRTRVLIQLALLITLTSPGWSQLPRLGSSFGQTERIYFGLYFPGGMLDSCIVSSGSRTLVSYTQDRSDTLTLTEEQWSELRRYLLNYETTSDSIYRGLRDRSGFEAIDKFARHRQIGVNSNPTRLRVDASGRMFEGFVLSISPSAIFLSQTDEEAGIPRDVMNGTVDQLLFKNMRSVEMMSDGQPRGKLPLDGDEDQTRGLVVSLIDVVAFENPHPPEVSPDSGQNLFLRELVANRPVTVVGRDNGMKVSINSGLTGVITTPTVRYGLSGPHIQSGGPTVRKTDTSWIADQIATQWITLNLEAVAYYGENFDLGGGFSTQQPLTTTYSEIKPGEAVSSYSSYSVYALGLYHFLYADRYHYSRIEVSGRFKLGLSAMNIASTMRYADLEADVYISEDNFVLQPYVGAGLQVGLWISDPLMLVAFGDIVGTAGGSFDEQETTFFTGQRQYTYRYSFDSGLTLATTLGLGLTVQF